LSSRWSVGARRSADGRSALGVLALGVISVRTLPSFSLVHNQPQPHHVGRSFVLKVRQIDAAVCPTPLCAGLRAPKAIIGKTVTKRSRSVISGPYFAAMRASLYEPLRDGGARLSAVRRLWRSAARRSAFRPWPSAFRPLGHPALGPFGKLRADAASAAPYSLTQYTLTEVGFRLGNVASANQYHDLPPSLEVIGFPVVVSFR